MSSNNGNFPELPRFVALDEWFADHDLDVIPVSGTGYIHEFTPVSTTDAIAGSLSISGNDPIVIDIDGTLEMLNK